MSFLRKQESSPAFDGIEITGLPLEFIPYLMRGGSDEFGIIRGSLKNDETGH